jgi:transposase
VSADRREVPASAPEPVEALRRENEQLRRDLERSERERGKLERENARLKEELEAARRTGARQAAPFSKGAPKRRPRRPGRKPGEAYGRQGHRRQPVVVDEVRDVPLPSACPTCGGAVEETTVATQYQEDLPPVKSVTRRFDIHFGCCTACQRRVQPRHPLQTSDALGAAAVQLGPQAVAVAISRNRQFGLSFGKIATLFRDRFGLTVTRGALVRALHRAAAQPQPTYEALCETVRTSPVVVPDETGWKVAAVLHWLWVFATATTTVYAIRGGRGFADAAAVLGVDFAGALSRDGWAPYRQFTQAAHQTCLAHLLRRCRLMQGDHPRARFPARVAAVLGHALTVRDRAAAGTITMHGAAVVRGHLIAQLATLLEQPGTIPDVQRFARHLDVEFSAVFGFLFDPHLDDELARRASAPTRSDHAQGLWRWQSHATRR